MKFPAVYAKVFEDAIPALAHNEMKSAVRTPVVHCDPGTQPHADDLSSSSLDSFALRDIFLAQNTASNEKLQEAMFDSVRGILKSARRPVGTPAPLDGAKPTVTQFIQFVENISQKFSTQNCDTSMALDLWLKDLCMPDSQR